jgi:hypothetical protein
MTRHYKYKPGNEHQPSPPPHKMLHPHPHPQKGEGLTPLPATQEIKCSVCDAFLE